MDHSFAGSYGGYQPAPVRYQAPQQMAPSTAMGRIFDKQGNPIQLPPGAMFQGRPITSLAQLLGEVGAAQPAYQQQVFQPAPQYQQQIYQPQAPVQYQYSYQPQPQPQPQPVPSYMHRQDVAHAFEGTLTGTALAGLGGGSVGGGSTAGDSPYTYHSFQPNPNYRPRYYSQGVAQPQPPQYAQQPQPQPQRPQAAAEPQAASNYSTGIKLREEPGKGGGLVVVRLTAGSSAALSGVVAPGHVLIRIGGYAVPATGLDVAYIRSLLSGARGSRVNLAFRRQDGQARPCPPPAPPMHARARARAGGG